ncbi:MAG: choice-of-anchor Q domain-containing protein, partial [Planctomycetota bacterium]
RIVICDESPDTPPLAPVLFAMVQFTIRSTTLTGNGGQAVGGLRCRNGSLTLTSSIIAENEGSTAPDLFLDGTTLNSTGFNLIGDASGVPGFLPSDLLGTSASPLDPLLAPLAPNGGLTETRLPLELSPALDAGDPSNTEPVDQRGEPRLAGLGDIGSVEALPVGLGDPIPGCVGAPNSTGAIGRTRTAGSLDVSSNDFALVATSLPPGQFGVFVVSRTPGFSAGAGGSSDGNLCLAGAIGRFNGPGQIVNSGTNGIASLDVDFTAIPTPTAFVTAAAGETWFFQAWHRDSGGLGSNFTEGEGVLLR